MGRVAIFLPDFTVYQTTVDDATPRRRCTRIGVKNLERVSQKMDRRKFIAFSAGAAVCMVYPCRSSVGSSISNGVRAQMPELTLPSPENIAATTWSTVPTITFTQGVAASVSVATYVSNADSLEIIKNPAALPPGVTYDVAAKSIVYDGCGASGFSDGHVLTAIGE